MLTGSSAAEGGFLEGRVRALKANDITKYFLSPNFSGIHVNNNLNNLKSGTEHSRTIAYSQGTVKSGKLEQSSTKPAATDKIVLLVCNRACTGQQSKR